MLTIADGVSPTATVPSLFFTNLVYFLLFLVIGAVMITYSRRVLYQGPDGDGKIPARKGSLISDVESEQSKLANRSVSLA